MTPLLRVADVTKQFGGFSALSRVMSCGSISKSNTLRFSRWCGT